MRRYLSKVIHHVACNAGVFLERERWIILCCCHEEARSRGLEQVQSDPKGENDRLSNGGVGRGRGAFFSYLRPYSAPTRPCRIRELHLLSSSRPWKNACTAGYSSSRSLFAKVGAPVDQFLLFLWTDITPLDLCSCQFTHVSKSGRQLSCYQKNFLSSPGKFIV